jgi:hypothetical protein
MAKRKSKTTSVQPGEVLKGFRVKLRPTQEDLRYLSTAQVELMTMWNILVITWKTHVDYCVRHCEDLGLIGPVPPRPTSDQDTNVPEEIAEWEEYAALCRERRRSAREQCKTVEGLTRRDWANRALDYHQLDLTEKAREQTQIDYRVLRSAVKGVTTAHMAQAVIETYKASLQKGRPPPKLKRRPLEMPLLLRSGKDLLTLSANHSTRTTASGKKRLTGSHHCIVKFGPLKIGGRFNRPPSGPFLQGISIGLEKDGWYASAKVRTLPEDLPKPTKEIIAINPGLECLYADNEGYVIENPRGNAYSLRMREMSDWIDDAETQWDEAHRRNHQARYAERFARHTEDLIYSRILPKLADYETILIGKAGKTAAQGRQNRISKNDEGGYVSAMSLMQQLIIQRYGLYDPDENPTGRVRVLESMGISRRCSRCGTEHATRYQRNNLRRYDQQTDCQEPSCRLKIHVDVGAARNLLSNYRDLQAAAE